MTREFILNTLLPYKEDPSTCGYDIHEKLCLYLTNDKKRCAVGKHLIEGEHLKYCGNVNELFDFYEKEDILTQEALDQDLPDFVWTAMQDYHDSIAMKRDKVLLNAYVKKIESSTRFEFPELYFN